MKHVREDASIREPSDETAPINMLRHLEPVAPSADVAVPNIDESAHIDEGIASGIVLAEMY